MYPTAILLKEIYIGCCLQLFLSLKKYMICKSFIPFVKYMCGMKE